MSDRHKIFMEANWSPYGKHEKIFAIWKPYGSQLSAMKFLCRSGRLNWYFNKYQACKIDKDLNNRDKFILKILTFWFIKSELPPFEFSRPIIHPQSTSFSSSSSSFYIIEKSISIESVIYILNIYRFQWNLQLYMHWNQIKLNEKPKTNKKDWIKEMQFNTHESQ